MLKNGGRQLGNYRISRLLGRGGFAEVYYGEHIYLTTPAAIKVLNVAIAGNEHEKFLAEARIAARLEHPHIISVLEFGIEANIPYLVMDYAMNGTLRQRHPKGSCLSPVQIISYIQQIAEALQYTHNQQLIHRDIKPENMLLGNNDTVLLSDFGIALVVQQAQNTKSEQHVVGTIAYMSPEQLQGEACLSSDQYALGAVIYEWLCGEPPFVGSYTEIAVQHALLPPVPLRQRRPDISAAVEEVVLTALAKDPRGRFRNMQAFAAAFVEACALTGYQPATSFQDVTAPFGETAPVRTVQAEAKASENKRGSRRTIVGVLLAGIGLSAGGIIAGRSLLQRFFSSASSHTHLTPAGSPLPGTTIYTYHGHPFLGYGLISTLAWSHDSQRIASAYDNVQIWYATTGKIERIYRAGLYGDVYNGVAAWSPDNHYLAMRIASASSDTIETWIWDALSGKKISSKQEDSGNAIVLAWSPDSTLLVSGYMGGLQVWHALTGEILSTYHEQDALSYALTWSPDGKFIASVPMASDGDTAPGLIHVWEAATGKTQTIYKGHTGPVKTLAWSPDGVHIVSGEGYYTSTDGLVKNLLHIWKPGSEKPLLIYRGHPGPVTAVAWDPGSKLIASGGLPKDEMDSGYTSIALAQVWNAASGQTILNYLGHNHQTASGVTAMAWSPNGKLIASGGSDGTVQVWTAPE